MEDDWASPWADADDRGPTEVIRILDVEDAKDAGGAGIDVPQPRIPDSNVAVHTNDPWGSGEHGFGDASAWSNPSPGVGSGEISGVVGGSGLSEWVGPVSAGVPSFSVKNAAEKTELPSATRSTTQQLGGKKKDGWFGATDEADAWAAGSDWGDGKAVGQVELNAGGGLSPDTILEIKPLPNTDTVIEGTGREVSAYAGNHRENQSTEILDRKSVEIGTEMGAEPESTISEITLTKEALQTLETASVGDLTKHQGEFEGNTKTAKAEVRNDDDDDDDDDGDGDDDDFGDFADGEGFEDTEENLPKDTAAFAEELPHLPQTLPLKVDISFNIDTSLLNKLYPILTSYPKNPPLKEIIHTTNSRKAWYRLSQSGTIRKDKSGDDDYVRVTWGGSKIQEDVNRIVAKWMAEDRSSGGGVALGGSQRLGAMFGWGEGAESTEKKAPPVQLNLVKDNHSHQNSIGLGKTSESGITKSPFSIATTQSTDSGTISSPQIAGFGWSSFDNSQPTVESRPSSSSNSVKSDEKLPSTPYRASFQGTSSRILSQPVTPSRSAVSHSPTVSSHSSKLSHSLATTRPSSPSPQSIQRTTEVIATTPIISTSMDNPFTSTPMTPTSVGKPESTKVSLPSSNFDEWGAFENIAMTVNLPSTSGANSNFGEWGAFEDLTKTVDLKPTGSVSGQGLVSALSQPPKASEAKDQAINSNEDEWNAFKEPLPPKTAISSGFSEKQSPKAAAELEEQKMGSLAVFADPLKSKPTVPEQPLTQPSTRGPIESGPRSLGVSGLGPQQTDDWSSFEAFESSLEHNPPVFAPNPTRVSEESSHRSNEAPGPGSHSADNWSSFEAFESVLTSKPNTSNLPLENSPAYTTHGKKLAEKPIPKAQNIDSWGSFDSFEAPKPKPASNLQQPVFVRSSGATTKSFTSHAPPVISAPAANDDDDDWGEMVQSPEIPRGSSPFSTVIPTPLQPTLSPNITTPRAMSPASFQNTQPQPQPQPLIPSVASTASMFDFSSFEKSPTPDNTMSPNGNGGNDTWDLSFFEGSGSSTSTPVNVSAPVFSNQASNDLWDAPPPGVTGRRENAKEIEESKLVNQLVEGLPDLSYMLQ